MTTQRPVVVIGAGPAGLAAAAAASAGPVMLLDERRLRVAVPGGIDYRPGTSAWALFPGPVVAVFDDAGAFEIVAGAVIIATGATDRAWPVPGWELDGVLTPAEALVAPPVGSIGVLGPEAGEVAAVLANHGGEIAATVPDLAGVRIEGEGRVQRLGGVPVDAVVLALGRLPDPALALQARAASAFDRRALIERPLLAPDGATSVSGVFLTGEAAGFAGDAAVAHGAAAGRAAARFAGGGAQSTDLAMPALLDLAPLPLPAAPATMVDRHQGVDLAALRAAIADGAWDVNDLRRRTRAGMGEGREVLPVLAALLLESDPAISDLRLAARVRPPVRPLPFRAVLAGERAS
jgi:hypothetical protein